MPQYVDVLPIEDWQKLEIAEEQSLRTLADALFELDDKCYWLRECCEGRPTRQELIALLENAVTAIQKQLPHLKAMQAAQDAEDVAYDAHKAANP